MTGVAVIGLGIMGGSITRHLIAAGFSATGFDVDANACTRAAVDGSTIAESIADACRGSIPVILSLASIEAARSVVREISNAGHRNIVVDTSTFSVAEKVELATTLSAGDSMMLDCPVSGTGAQMAARDAVIYASGPADALVAVRPLLDAISSQFFDLGAFGMGTAMKLVANHLVAIHNVATAEAMLVGMKAGISPDTLMAAVRAGAGNSRIFELRAPMVAADRYDPATMKLDVWAKDMAAIRAFTEQMGVATPLLDATVPIYERALAEKLGPLDTAAVARLLSQKGDKCA